MQSLPSISLVLIRCQPRLTIITYTTLFRSPMNFKESAAKAFEPLKFRRLSNQAERHLHSFGMKTGKGNLVSLYTLKLRSEEHTSELQSRGHLVCRLLLEKTKKSLIINEILI